MAPTPDMEAIVGRIVKAAHPEKIILFGSRARGDHRPDSDIDLLVVVKKVENRGRMMVDFRSAVGSVGFGVDVLVYSPAEMKQRAEWDSSAISWALKEGKVLYERARRRSKNVASLSQA